MGSLPGLSHGRASEKRLPQPRPSSLWGRREPRVVSVSVGSALRSLPRPQPRSQQSNACPPTSRSFVQRRWFPKRSRPDSEELAEDPLPGKMRDSVVRLVCRGTVQAPHSTRGAAHAGPVTATAPGLPLPQGVLRVVTGGRTLCFVVALLCCGTSHAWSSELRPAAPDGLSCVSGGACLGLAHFGRLGTRQSRPGRGCHVMCVPFSARLPAQL